MIAFTGVPGYSCGVVPRAVPKEAAKRRRERLAELIAALGAARGGRVTQREFAASIGREQGTVAAILGGHRSLGGDVMLAVVQAYGLPADYFDARLRPDPRPFARAAARGVPSLAPARASEPTAASSLGIDAALEDVVEALRPDLAVAVALRAVRRAGSPRPPREWLRLAVGAQGALQRGRLIEWYDRVVGEAAGDRPGTVSPSRARRRDTA